jgi:fructosamine-3-kinase
VRRGAEAIAGAVESATGRRPRRLAPLSGGCIAEIYKVELDGGGTVVAKVAPEGGLGVEAFMLDYLGRHSALPVPAVLHGTETLLLMEYVETSGGLDTDAQSHAAELLAALHGIGAEAFGFERDTVIGPLPQPNPRSERWGDFFRDHRLLHMGRVALERGRLPAAVFADLERFCARIERYIGEPAAPSLIHGDMWGGNVLTHGGRIAAFVDPAIYHADAEIELAFSTLFSTFGRPFFDRYRELRPIDPGFFEARRDIYNLYPLLVHTALFGGHYASAVARTLGRFV